MIEEKAISPKNEESLTKKTPDSAKMLWYKLTLSIAFLAISGLFIFIKNLNDLQIKTLNQEISKLDALIVKNEKLNQNTMTQINTDFAEKLTKLDKKIAKTLQETAYISNDWIMQKAKYYLELAVINNNWTDDTKTTQKLLIAANSTLSKIQKDEIVEVKKLIADEKLQISALNKLDTMKLLIDINALKKYLTSLSIIPLKDRLKIEKPTKNSKFNSNNSWQTNFKNNLKKLNKLIIIRRNNQNATNILSPSYLATIRETIKLNIQQMQWAILERNQDIYKFSCQQAIDNISYALDAENPDKKIILDKLYKLQKINLNIKKIKINQSLIALNKIIYDNENSLSKDLTNAS